VQPEYNSNYQEKKINLTEKDGVVSKSLGELDSIILEKAFLNQDLPDLVDLEGRSNFVIENALYITEIDDLFYFLDYTTEDQNPLPTPIKSRNSNATQLSATSISKSELDFAKATQNPAKSSLPLGKKGLLIGLGLGVLLTLGATRLFSPPTANNQESELAKVAETSVPAQTVTISEVKSTLIDSTLDASGTVNAYESTPVMSQATGLQITEVLAERGDFVKQGQVLAKLNNKALTAQQVEAEAVVAQQQAALDELQEGSRVEEIAQAEARVANANSAVVTAESDLELIQKRVERDRSLQQEGAITRDRLDETLNQEKVANSDLVGVKASLNEARQALRLLQVGSRRQTITQAEAQLTQAQGRLQAIESQLEDTTIVAPVKGIIASREAKVGQIASTSEMLFSIIQDGRLELRLKVPETLISKIQPGQKVKVTSNGNSNLQLTGKIRAIDPVIDDTSRQALVKVDLPSNANLKPGMFLRAAINTDTNQGIAVPIEALLPQSENSATAFVLQQNNTVKAQTVEMGEIVDNQTVEVVNGLNSGDLIVLKGAAYLKDGDAVEVSKDN